METGTFKSITLLLILFSVTSIVSISPVKAEYGGDIIIEADGSITPATAALENIGNVYSLTTEISGTITVKNNNIVLDGSGHTLTVPPIFGRGIKLYGVSNVTVSNFIIDGGAIGINLNGTLNTVKNNTIRNTDNWIYAMQYPTGAIVLHDSSSNIITGNNLENNTVGINLASWNPRQCKNNLIVENYIKNSSTAILVYDSSNNSIYHNNFLNNTVMLQDTGYSGYSLPSINIWDDDHQFGNYWSDYLMKYPNATEKGNSGVGDSPYFVKPKNYVDISTLTRQEAKDHWIQINAQYANNTDYYPLMQPFTKSSHTSPEPTSTPYEESQQPEQDIAGSIFAVTSIVVFLGLLFYLIKRK
jgi:parallel beta-helix repeat protein